MKPIAQFYAWGFMLACFAAIGFLSVSLHPLDSDEGVILTGAWNLWLGQELYEDTFEYVAPGSYYLVAWVWHLTGGPDYGIAKAVAVAATAAAALATVHTARFLAVGRVSWWPALFFFMALNSGPVINHNTLFVLPASWSLYFAVRSLLRDSFWAGVASGLLCGCAILFLQHKGLALAVSTGLGLALAGGSAARQKLIRSLVYALVLLIPLLVVLRWDVALLVDNLVRFPAQHYLAVQHVSPVPWLLAALLLTWVFWQVAQAAGKATIMIALIQAALLLTALQRGDIHHLIVIAFPAVAIFPLFVRTFSFPPPPEENWSGRVQSLSSTTIVTLLAVLCLLVFLVTVVSYKRSSSVRAELVGVASKHCPTSRYLYAGPFIPGLYFEMRKAGATRYSVLLEGLNTDGQFAEAAQAINVLGPDCVVIESRLAQKFGHTGNNPVEQSIARNYRLMARVENFAIMGSIGFPAGR